MRYLPKIWTGCATSKSYPRRKRRVKRFPLCNFLRLCHDFELILKRVGDSLSVKGAGGRHRRRITTWRRARWLKSKNDASRERRARVFQLAWAISKKRAYRTNKLAAGREIYVQGDWSCLHEGCMAQCTGDVNLERTRLALKANLLQVTHNCHSSSSGSTRTLLSLLFASVLMPPVCTLSLQNLASYD